MYEILMTADDFRWLMSLVDERKKFAEACQMCSECDIFDKCQEERRDYCEKEEVSDERDTD